MFLEQFRQIGRRSEYGFRHPAYRDDAERTDYNSSSPTQ